MVEVEDGNGCVVTFFVMVTEPDQIIASLVANNNAPDGSVYHISCYNGNDGVATVTNGGGVPPINYSWSSSSNTLPIETGLFAGDVTVTVTDGNNCTEDATITLLEPPYLNPNLEESNYSPTTTGFDLENEMRGFLDE